MRCPLCEQDPLRVRFTWTEPPEGETRFRLPDGQRYERRFLECPRCGHFLAELELDVAALYERGYVDATYADGLDEDYERIMALPPERSDNARRVERVDSFERERGFTDRLLLDVGSGLCVFAARMKERGWEATVLDPDPRAVAHARERVGVEAVEGDFMEAGGLGEFPLVTLNKVLEHVADPVEMLSRARDVLAPGGTVYVEVPDGEAAAADDGPRREEFFIEHLHAFSAASLALLARRAGFELLRLDRLREPSGKYTLTAFLT